MEESDMWERQRKEEEIRVEKARYREERDRTFKDLVERLQLCRGSEDVKLVEDTLSRLQKTVLSRPRVVYHNIEQLVRDIL